MKIFITRILLSQLFILFLCYNVNAQISFDFEDDAIMYPFEDFDGGTATVIDNPQIDATNPSSKVAQIIRDGGEVWAGSKLLLSSNLDFSTNSVISMKVFSTAPVGTIVKLKLENSGVSFFELDRQTTVSNQWETIEWDFTGQPMDFYYLVFMFDFGVAGDGSANSTFWFDDVEQLYAGAQIDWPVDWEGTDINYTVSDFGGNQSTLVVDPENTNNHVIQSIKTDAAATWAGTTIGTPAGFATNIPLTLDNSIMSVRVWSPEKNTPIRLKVEDSNDPTHTCETEVLSTVAEQWEVLEFDFTNQAPGTELLSIGLQMGWTYNMASIFFNFGTEGAVAGEKTYYFDEVVFGDLVLNVNDDLLSEEIKVSPNPTNHQWNITFQNIDKRTIELYDVTGKMMSRFDAYNKQINVSSSNFEKGVYICKIKTAEKLTSIKLFKSE